MIRFENASFDYGTGIPALHPTDLEIGPGLSLLLGPNGAGKSSLLKLAAGVERPRTGRVFVGEYDLWVDEVEARRQLAYVPEHPDLSPYATIADVARLVCSLRGEPMEAGGAALARAGLANLGSRTVRELSMGQRRRALLAMAFVGHPAHVLLDEPLEGMDRGMQDSIVAWVEQLADANVVVLIATHELEPFVSLATRAVIVADGRAELVDRLPDAPVERLAALERFARGVRRAEGAG
ncbi:MAG: ABC transporter ATP-binding protein [Gemmatimonadota bacterium]